MSDQEFISGSDADDDDLRAYDEGLLTEWRRAPDGTQWYRRAAAGAAFPEIRAVPADDVQAADGPMELDDFERAQLQQWADDLRRGGGDEPEEADE
ncbi:MAG: hypothetical protein GXY58_10740 [Planctomycetaceae bacterium]|nr:hypothetical protein [Planctomycetaceae bacterium]